MAQDRAGEQPKAMVARAMVQGCDSEDRMKPTLSAMIAAAVLFAATQAKAATFYVATTGDDATGDGSSVKPWRTIEHAANVGIPAGGGDTILVRDGTYMGVNLLDRAFPTKVTIRSDNPYKAVLTNVDGGMEAIRVYINGSANLAIQGFVITNGHPTYSCPNGRENYYLIHLQDVSDLSLEDNIIFGANAPGTCNEVLKINRSVDTAYPKNIVVRGNVFYDQANAAGADLIDSVRPGEIEIVDNIFFGNPDHAESQSFITLKRQVQASNPGSPRYRVHRNVFLHWAGKSDQAFVQFGEDGVAEYEISDALVENNLLLGDSPASMAAPFQFKGVRGVLVRANTVVGDVPGGAFGFRIGTEGQNLQIQDITVHGNLFSDPAGTMGQPSNRFMMTYGDVLLSSITLDHNLFWNGGNALPDQGSVTPALDANKVVADPKIATDQSGIVLPRWDANAGAFSSGSKSIREEFLRLVNRYGALGVGSGAIDAADPSQMPAGDIRGLARGANPDIGAFEFGAVEPAPDAGAAGSGGGQVGGAAGSGAAGKAGTAGNWGGGGQGGMAQLDGSIGGSAGAGIAGQGAASKSADSGGCGCRAAKTQSPGHLWLLAAGLAMAAGRGRRPRRSR
jgi:MYXO-CTERM domain-containing protein